jgi:hypothetical protein
LRKYAGAITPSGPVAIRRVSATAPVRGLPNRDALDAFAPTHDDFIERDGHGQPASRDQGLSGPTPEEIALMNEGKALAEQVGASRKS